MVWLKLGRHYSLALKMGGPSCKNFGSNYCFGFFLCAKRHEGFWTMNDDNMDAPPPQNMHYLVCNIKYDITNQNKHLEGITNT
jgi:hypothetical protein